MGPNGRPIDTDNNEHILKKLSQYYMKQGQIEGINGIFTRVQKLKTIFHDEIT